MRRHLMILTLLWLGPASCSGSARSEGHAQRGLEARALLVVRYAPAAPYGDLSIRPVVVLDDGSGERTITAEELLAPSPCGHCAFRDMRTSGDLRLRVLLLAGAGRDTLASAAARLPLEPDLVWQVTVTPGLVVDEVVAPLGRLDPSRHVAAPISGPSGHPSGDSLYVIWVPARRSEKSQT